MTDFATPVWTGDDLSNDEFLAIVELLRRLRQFDIGQYKDRCIRRRIAKRLRTCQVSSVSSYLVRLEKDADELDTLLATLSIHVSQFFRNPDTFMTLEQQVLPKLCQDLRDAGREQIRLWSVGCAGGEEPYSLALLMDELAPEGLKVEILATDVSQPVLDVARQGLYENSRLAEVPEPVLQKYFQTEEGQFRLVDRIRQMVRFERHNIMTAEDCPPADLILCRNVLIYFTRTEQERILRRFAEALPPFGVLVLGRSETMVGPVREFFKSSFPVERIYRRSSRTGD